MNESGSYRRYAFTSYEEDHVEFDDKVMSYLIVGSEVCPETGRPHWQCYVELIAKTRFSTMKKMMPGVHFEPCHGTAAQNFRYCSKGGYWQEWGSMTKMGERNDLKAVAEECLDGARYGRVAEEYPVQFLKYHKGIRELCSIAQKKKARPWRDLTVTLYYGDSGTGKTSKAVSDCDDFYIKEAGCPWFDGYDGERRLVLDELDRESAPPYATLLRILDGHPCQVPFKGGMVWAQWTEVVITSNQSVDQWYPGRDLSALRRRIHKITKFELDPIEAQVFGSGPPALRAGPPGPQPDSQASEVSSHVSVPEVEGNTSLHLKRSVIRVPRPPIKR